MLKRKRAPNNNRGATYNDSELPTIDGPSLIPQLQKSRTEGPRGSPRAVSGTSEESAPRPAPQGLSSAMGTRAGISLEEILSSTVGPADMTESPKEVQHADLKISNPM